MGGHGGAPFHLMIFFQNLPSKLMPPMGPLLKNEAPPPPPLKSKAPFQVMISKA